MVTHIAVVNGEHNNVVRQKTSMLIENRQCRRRSDRPPKPVHEDASVVICLVKAFVASPADKNEFCSNSDVNDSVRGRLGLIDC